MGTRRSYQACAKRRRRRRPVTTPYVGIMIGRTIYAQPGSTAALGGVARASVTDNTPLPARSSHAPISVAKFLDLVQKYLN